MERLNYYGILGIDRGASGDEIKHAYRRLARRFHPDVSADPDGERQFKAVAEAYRMLKGRETRRDYDRREPQAFGGGVATMANALDAWCSLLLWPGWSWFWRR